MTGRRGCSPRGTGAGAPQPSFEPGEPDDVAVVLHTSGTTSRPKQVPLLQRNLMASVAHDRCALPSSSSADVSFCVMPLFHIHGLVASAFAALSTGRRRSSRPRRFTPHRFWPQAREHGATWLSAGPTLHQMILDRADAAARRPRCDSCARAARRCSPALLERAERELPGADAGGLRHDRGEPPDGLQPASAGRAGAGLGRRANRHRDRRGRRRRDVPARRAAPARSSSAVPA